MHKFSDQEKIAIILFISPSKFKEGGEAIFEVQSINHPNAKAGAIICSPLMTNKLREFKRQ